MKRQVKDAGEVAGKTVKGIYIDKEDEWIVVIVFTDDTFVYLDAEWNNDIRISFSVDDNYDLAERAGIACETVKAGDVIESGTGYEIRALPAGKSEHEQAPKIGG